jgi:hypothetical protein
MATPTTTTAVTLTATSDAMQAYEVDLENLLRGVGHGELMRVLQDFFIDLGKYMASVNALAGAPAAGEKTEALATQTAYNRLARVIAGTDP